MVSAFWRYWLLQIPGWIVLCAGLYLAHLWVGVSLATALVLLGLWLLKDLLLYPILSTYYEPRQVSPHVSFVGRRAVSREPLLPSGYVELNGQLWQARSSDDGGGSPIEAGESVEVRGVDGLTLIVCRAAREEPGSF